eukprot:3177440-Amphidinium_carterae.1
MFDVSIQALYRRAQARVGPLTCMDSDVAAAVEDQLQERHRDHKVFPSQAKSFPDQAPQNMGSA